MQNQKKETGTTQNKIQSQNKASKQKAITQTVTPRRQNNKTENTQNTNGNINNTKQIRQCNNANTHTKKAEQ